ncbi:hypothetical protein HZB03_03620 [Candidatus Woesearchaeota archaeon]|nr:hypothetical protein [Candidatus Woesearchaeota archaeon]
MSLFSMFCGNNKCKLPTLKNPTVVYLFECLSQQHVTVSPMKQFTLFPGECYMQASFVRGYLDELVIQEHTVLRGRNDHNHREVAIQAVYRSIARYFESVDSLEAELYRQGIDRKVTSPFGLSRLRVYETTLLQQKKKAQEMQKALCAASQAYWK